jgi:hypothetical protein
MPCVYIFMFISIFQMCALGFQKRKGFEWIWFSVCKVGYFLLFGKVQAILCLQNRFFCLSGNPSRSRDFRLSLYAGRVFFFGQCFSSLWVCVSSAGAFSFSGRCVISLWQVFFFLFRWGVFSVLSWALTHDKQGVLSGVQGLLSYSLLCRSSSKQRCTTLAVC